jgi:lipopolysaccharide export system permease protein
MMAVIMLLAMVFDLADKLNDFIQAGASASEIIFDYFFNFMLLYANMFSPMIIFVSVIWFTSKITSLFHARIAFDWHSRKSTTGKI